MKLKKRLTPEQRSKREGKRHERKHWPKEQKEPIAAGVVEFLLSINQKPTPLDLTEEEHKQVAEALKRQKEKENAVP